MQLQEGAHHELIRQMRKDDVGDDGVEAPGSQRKPREIGLHRGDGRLPRAQDGEARRRQICGDDVRMRREVRGKDARTRTGVEDAQPSAVRRGREEAPVHAPLHRAEPARPRADVPRVVDRGALVPALAGVAREAGVDGGEHQPPSMSA